MPWLFGEHYADNRVIENGHEQAERDDERRLPSVREMHLFPPNLLWKATLLEAWRSPRGAFPRFQVGLQADQEVFPIPSCLFISLIFLHEPIMCED